MIPESLEEQAALYAAGSLTALEREQFELVLEFHAELRSLMESFLDAAAAFAVGQPRLPSPELKDRILAQIKTHPQQTHAQGFVMAGPDGLVQWINPTFSAMCGYTLQELRGQRLGPILQGPLTDKMVALRVREAVRRQEPCTEALINYHKNGRPYWVSLNITPIHDTAGKLLWYVARELELTERQIPVA